MTAPRAHHHGRRRRIHGVVGRRARAVAAAVCLLVVASACTGPDALLAVGMNDRTVDIVLGERARVVTEVVPPSLPVQVDLPPSSPVPPPQPFQPAPPPPPPPPPAPGPHTFELPPCTPPAEVVVAEEDSALGPPKAPPAEATYEYFTTAFLLFVDPSRAEIPPDPENLPELPPDPENISPDPGTIPINGSPLPPITTRTVAEVVAEPAVAGLEPFTFDVVWDAGERSSTSSYRIVIGDPPVAPPDDGDEEPTDGLPPEGDPLVERVEGVDPGPLVPGLYLTQSDRTSMDGFAPPAPGMKLVEFPVEGGATFAATATDGTTTMDYTSTVSFSPVVIDACDTWVEGWPVEIEGTVTSTSIEFLGHQVVHFEAEYVIAPQFGGLILDENILVTNPDDGESGVVLPLRASTAKIQSVPQPAGGDAG